MFSRLVTDYWVPSHARSCADEVGWHQIVVDDALPTDRSLMLVEPVGGSGMLFATSATIERLGLNGKKKIKSQELPRALATAHIRLNGADHLFYLTVAEKSVVQSEPVTSGTRRLHEADADAFGVLAAKAPEEDLDEAFVDLGHWLAFGTFVDGRLASVASMYPWRDSHLADLGVLTLPQYRGRGCAKATVRALSGAALVQGYEPQYRCQLDNAPSIALARSAGFERFGTWDVIDDRAD
ncbi:GNAT family N-acetyltransferase [Modestobacter altitudinis]|uniref:GNAT family N-acetyltransferase n=1 Tax=Modestobacter altitudinis TaxID=2213158 RepID=UPI00110CA7EB|nr:GNAT family N-acetyltransferase [Modestobacter altitudinis]